MKNMKKLMKLASIALALAILLPAVPGRGTTDSKFPGGGYRCYSDKPVNDNKTK